MLSWTSCQSEAELSLVSANIETVIAHACCSPNRKRQTWAAVAAETMVGLASYRRTVIWVLDKGVAAYIPLVAKAIDNMNTAPVYRAIICTQKAKPCEGAVLAMAMSTSRLPTRH